MSVLVDDPTEAERIFGELSVTMPIGTTWAERFGMVTDKFGTPWMVNCDCNSSAADATASLVTSLSECLDATAA